MPSLLGHKLFSRPHAGHSLPGCVCSTFPLLHPGYKILHHSPLQLLCHWDIQKLKRRLKSPWLKCKSPKNVQVQNCYHTAIVSTQYALHHLHKACIGCRYTTALLLKTLLSSLSTHTEDIIQVSVFHNSKKSMSYELCLLRKIIKPKGVK